MVEDGLSGLWERISLEDASGVDRTTRVCWLQAGMFYCDLRVPWPRPAFDGRCLADYSDAQLHWLLAQQGFAGRLQVTGDLFRWHRLLDFQPDTTVIDAGRMRAADGLVIEEGVHATYREEWRHTPPVNADRVALELLDEQDSHGRRPRRGFLLVAGDWFMYACDRPVLPPPAPSLHALVAAAPDQRAALLALADCELSFGLCGGARPWQVVLSTLPFREGQSLFAPGEWPGAPMGQESLQRVRGIMRRWRVHTWNAAVWNSRSE